MLPLKESTWIFIVLSVLVFKTALGLSMSALHMEYTEQIFVEWMNEGMYKHPDCKINFATFLSWAAPLTFSGSDHCLPSTLQILPYEFPPPALPATPCDEVQLHNSSRQHLICIWFDWGQNAH